MSNVVKVAASRKSNGSPLLGEGLIRDKAVLTKAIHALGKASEMFHTGMNRVFMSALAHAAAHRDPDLLNNCFAILKPAYQTQAKQYIHGHCQGFMTMKKGKFVIIRKEELHTSEEASKAFAGKADDLYKEKAFYDYKLTSAKDPFANENVLALAKRMLKEAEKDDAKVTPAMLAEIKAFAAKVQEIGVAAIN